MSDSEGGGPDGERRIHVDRWLLRAGVLATVLVGAGLHLRLDAGLTESFFAAFLLFTLPLLSILQLSALEEYVVHRPAIYLSSAVTMGVLTLIALGVGFLEPGLHRMGLVGLAAPGEGLGAFALATLRLTLATALLAALFWLIERWTGFREHPLLLALIPRTRRERRAFAGLSVVAGVGEEIVFRGFLLAVLIPALGDPWLALVVSSLAFGVLHSYQGSWGITRTGLLGALLGASVVLDGSLWPAIVVHVVYDWIGGLVIGPRALPPSGPGTGGGSRGIRVDERA